MKKRLILSVSTLILCITIIVGVSYAILSDKHEITGGIVVGSVDVDATIYYEDEEVNSININNINPGETYLYKIKLENNGSYDIRYRNVFDIDDPKNLVNVLHLRVSNVNEEYKEIEFKSDRGISDWDIDLKAKETYFYYIEFKLDESIDNQYANATFDFKLTIEAIENRISLISSDDDLDKLISNEYAILTNDIENLEITKSLYLDLNGFKINNLIIDSTNELFVELHNGEISELTASSPNSTIYCYSYVDNGVLNTSNDSFHYLTNEEGETNFTLYGGKLVLDTNSNIEIDSLEKTDTLEKNIVVKEGTTVSSLNVYDETYVLNEGEILSLKVEDVNLNIEGNKVENINMSTEVAIVSKEDSQFYYTIDEVTYQIPVVSIDEALNSDFNYVYLTDDTYYLDEQVLSDITLHGSDAVTINLNANITLQNDVTIKNINFINDKTLIINSNDVLISDCTFDSFVALEVKDANSLTLENNIMYGYAVLVDSDNTSVIVEGNDDNVLYLSNSKTVVSQKGSDLYLNQEGRMFKYFNTSSTLNGLQGDIYLLDDYYINQTIVINNETNIIGDSSSIKSLDGFNGVFFNINNTFTISDVCLHGNSNTAFLLENQNYIVDTTNSTFNNFDLEVVIYLDDEMKVEYFGLGNLIKKYTNKNVVANSLSSEYKIDESTYYVATSTEITSDNLKDDLYIIGTHNLLNLSIENDIVIYGLDCKLIFDRLLCVDSNVEINNVLIEGVIEFYGNEENYFNTNNTTFINGNQFDLFLHKTTSYPSVKTDCEVAYMDDVKTFIGSVDSYTEVIDGKTYIYTNVENSFSDRLLTDELYILPGEYNIDVEVLENIKIYGFDDVVLYSNEVLIKNVYIENITFLVKDDSELLFNVSDDLTLIDCNIDGFTNAIVANNSLLNINNTNIYGVSKGTALDINNVELSIVNANIEFFYYAILIDNSNIDSNNLVCDTEYRFVTKTYTKTILSNSTEQYVFEQIGVDALMHMTTHTSVEEAFKNSSVHILPGVYFIKSNIKITQDTKIFGSDESIIVNSFFKTPSTFITVEGCSVEINNVTFSNVVMYKNILAISAINSNVILNECIFTGFTYDTTKFDNTNVSISDSSFSACNNAIILNGGKSEITTSRFNGCVSGITITNCAYLELTHTTFTVCMSDVRVDDSVFLIVGEGMSDDIIINHVDDDNSLLGNVIIKKEFTFTEQKEIINGFTVTLNTTIFSELSLKAIEFLTHYYDVEEITYDIIIAAIEEFQDYELEIEVELLDYSLERKEKNLTLNTILFVSIK